MSILNRYQDLYPVMIPQLPACSASLILQALQKSARQFCIDTEIWSETLNSIDLVADQTDYTISSSWDAEIRRIKELRINTKANIAEGNDGAVQDPSLYKFTPEDALELDNSIKPPEAVTDGLEVDVCIIPINAAISVDYVLLNAWQEAIVAGAMVQLMVMPKQKWTNPTQAAYYNSQYNKMWNKAKVEKVRKNVNGSVGLSA